MVQCFKQIIYCNDKAENKYNYPSTIKGENLVDGSAFSDYMPLSQLGIQAPPGTKVFFNGDTIPVIIGFTGLFEVNLDYGGVVNSMAFDSASIENVQSNDSALIIVDMAYVGGA